MTGRFLRSFLALLLLGATGCASSSAPRGDPVAGETIANEVSPSCGHCHALASADFVGTAAPNLDQIQPGYARVLDAVRNGPGVMPSYSDVLTEQQMHDVAAFISGAAGN